MILGVLKEPEGEKRVALLPEGVAQLKKLNVDVWLEDGAGDYAFASNSEYLTIGAKVTSKSEIMASAQMLVKINPFSLEEIAQLHSGQSCICVLNPYQNGDLVALLIERKITSFSLDLVPRKTRAQAMDILSSMATVAGYRAVLDSALRLPKFFPMFMSAAGTVKPAKVLILGAGVAGLQAIATSRKLGAVVSVFDVRAAVKEEVQSLGGKFIEVEGARDEKSAGGYAVEQTEEFKQKQRQLIHDYASKSNVIITTAQIPGRKAPLLITKETVDAMAPGAVIIDLAASTGGNCELTKNDQTIVYNQVTIVGKSDYPADMPSDASKMFGNNLINFLKLFITKDKEFFINFEDDIISDTCLTHDGQLVNERIKQFLNTK